MNGNIPSFSFTEIESQAEIEKRKLIEKALKSKGDLNTWRNLAIGECGLVGGNIFDIKR